MHFTTIPNQPLTKVLVTKINKSPYNNKNGHVTQTSIAELRLAYLNCSSHNQIIYFNIYLTCTSQNRLYSAQLVHRHSMHKFIITAEQLKSENANPTGRSCPKEGGVVRCCHFHIPHTIVFCFESRSFVELLFRVEQTIGHYVTQRMEVSLAH